MSYRKIKSIQPDYKDYLYLVNLLENSDSILTEIRQNKMFFRKELKEATEVKYLNINAGNKSEFLRHGMNFGTSLCINNHIICARWENLPSVVENKEKGTINFSKLLQTSFLL